MQRWRGPRLRNITRKKGDVLLDEATNAAGEFFQAQRLEAALRADRWASAQGVCDAVWAALQTYSGISAPSDEVMPSG